MYVSTKQRQEMIFNKMGITSAQKVITYAHKITTSGLRSSLSEVKLNGDLIFFLVEKSIPCEFKWTFLCRYYRHHDPCKRVLTCQYRL